jgi:hypothetical protein
MYQFSKIEWSRPDDRLTEEEKYLSRNITSCDMALYCELLLKRYSDQGVRTHDYKNLHKKLDDAVRYMFEKGIYSDFETNRDEKLTLYFSEESFLYPDNFTADYSAERNGILKTLSDIFLLSRYGCFEYFDKYDEMLKFYRISKGIEIFVDGNEDVINKLYDFRVIVDYGEWYSFTVDEILSLDMDYLKRINEILKNNYHELSVLAYRNLIHVKDSTKEKIIQLLETNYKKYKNLLCQIGDDTIDYFMGDTTYVDAILDYNNDNGFLTFNGTKVGVSIDIPYYYQLITNEKIKGHAGLVNGIINNLKKYSISSIEKVIDIISNSKISLYWQSRIFCNIVHILDLPEDKWSYAIPMLDYVLESLNIQPVKITDSRFLVRNLKDIMFLVNLYNKYHHRYDDDGVCWYLSKADPSILRKLEKCGTFSDDFFSWGVVHFTNVKMANKYYEYVCRYGKDDIKDIDVFYSNLSIDDIHKYFIEKYYDAISSSKNANDLLDKNMEKISLLNKVFEDIPEFLTFKIINFMPDSFLQKDASRLRQLIRNNYFFTNFKSYSKEDQSYIVDYYERLIVNFSRGVLGGDFTRLFDIGSLSFYRDYPRALIFLNPRDYSYYIFTNMNLIYEKIKNGVFNCGGAVVKIEDTTELLNMFLNIPKPFNSDNSVISKDNTRILELLTDKGIIENMSQNIMTNGNKKIIDARIVDFKNNKLVKDFGKRKDLKGSIYDFITSAWFFYDVQDVNDIKIKNELYDTLLEYVNYLDNLYSNTGTKNLILNHLSHLFNCGSDGIAFLGYHSFYFYKFLKVVRSKLEESPDNIQSILEDFNLFLDKGDKANIEEFSNEDLADIMGKNIIEDEYDLSVPHVHYEYQDPVVEPGYFRLEKQSKIIDLEKPLYIFDLMKSIVTDNVKKLREKIHTALVNSSYRIQYLKAKEYLIRVCKIREMKFLRLERKLLHSLEKESEHVRSR